MKIAFFDTKKYDVDGFNRYASERGIDITYLDARLDIHTVNLAKGYDAVCAFVNDDFAFSIICDFEF